MRAALWLLLSLVPLAAGCGRQTCTVTGQVTFDGQPIELGEISFVPVDGAGTSEGAVITRGEFSCEVHPGKKQIRIRASRPVPGKPADPLMGPPREDFLPARYNDSSTMTEEIQSGQPNEFTFELTSDPPPASPARGTPAPASSAKATSGAR
jgi:hypothetical protein